MTDIKILVGEPDATAPTAGPWAPHSVQIRLRDESFVVSFVRLEAPALIALSDSFCNASSAMYGRDERFAVYAVILIDRTAAWLYEAAVVNDGDIRPASPLVVGPLNIPAPPPIQDAFQAFVHELNELARA